MTSKKIAGIVPYFNDSANREYNKKEFLSHMNNEVCDVFLQDFDLANNITRAHAFNNGVKQAAQLGYEYVGLFDIDISLPIEALRDTVKSLGSNSIDVVYPFSGMPIETDLSIASAFKPYVLDKNLLQWLFDEELNFRVPYSFKTPELLGLAVCMRIDTFFEVGGENPNFIGWGFEDHERYIRYNTLGKSITRLPYQITHRSHDQGIRKHSLWKHNYWEMIKVNSMSVNELKEYIKLWTV